MGILTSVELPEFTVDDVEMLVGKIVQNLQRISEGQGDGLTLLMSLSSSRAWRTLANPDALNSLRVILPFWDLEMS